MPAAPATPFLHRMLLLSNQLPRPLPVKNRQGSRATTPSVPCQFPPPGRPQRPAYSVTPTSLQSPVPSPSPQCTGPNFKNLHLELPVPLSSEAKLLERLCTGSVPAPISSVRGLAIGAVSRALAGDVVTDASAAASFGDAIEVGGEGFWG